MENAKINGCDRSDPEYGTMPNHDEKVKEWITLEKLLEGRSGDHQEMYFDLVATHTTKVSGKAAYRKYRRKKPFSKLVSNIDEVLAHVQLYNRWDAWMFEMPQDACAYAKTGRKPNRRVTRYDNAENCPKAKLSGKDKDCSGRSTGWRSHESTKEMKKQLKLVDQDRASGSKVEKKFVEKWKNDWRAAQKNPSRTETKEDDETSKSLEEINEGYKSNAQDRWDK